MPTTRKRILLGQLAASGDCLYATTIARQIKHDYPACHLTWAIGTMCRGIIDGNPHVDAVWEVPLNDYVEVTDAWNTFYAAAELRRSNGEFDLVFYTQIFPANFRNYDATVRASIFRGYPRPITVPVTPVVRLREDEIENVRRFADRHGLCGHPRVILFEFSSASLQSFVDPGFASKVALGLVAHLRDCKIIMSSQYTVASQDPRIISGHTLSFRENAELTKYCSLLIGCSSGITWLATSDWAKPLPMIQLLARDKGVYASVVHDHEHFGMKTDNIIEMTDCPADDVVDCAAAVFQAGFASAKKIYHVRLRINFDFCFLMLRKLIYKGAYRDALLSNWHILRRYGPRRAVLALNLRTLIHVLRFARANLGARMRRWFVPPDRRQK